MNENGVFKKCIISLGINNLYGEILDKHDSYNRAKRSTIFNKSLNILKQKIEDLDFDGDLFLWDKNLPEGCPSFIESPFAFKPFCFKEVRDKGYNFVLWIDSTIYPKSLFCLRLIFEEIKREGYFFTREISSIGECCSDEALKTLKANREDLMKAKEFGAGVIGLNFNNEKSNLFFEEWLRLSKDKVTFAGKKGLSYYCFNNKDNVFSSDPRVRGHRHDQTAANVIALKLDMVKKHNKRDFFSANLSLKWGI